MLWMLDLQRAMQRMAIYPVSLKREKQILTTMSGQKTNKQKTGNIQPLTRTLGLMIAALAFVIYFNTLRHGYVLDDFSLISENTVTTLGVKAIPDIFSHFYRYGYFSTNDGIYRPLPIAMFALEWSLSPGNPWLSHFINVLLYALTGWLVFVTLARLLKNYSLILPFIITLLFITHPVHTEVVANIKSRDELLCFLFSFATLYCLLNYLESGSKKDLCLSSTLFFLAFLSKETAITMVAAIPLALYFFTDQKKRGVFLSVILLAAVATVFLILRQFVIGSEEVSHQVSPVENFLLMSSGNAYRLATAVKILGNYLVVLFYPNKLVCDYSYHQISFVNFSDFGVILSLLIYLGMIIYGIFGTLRKELLAFGILFYLLSISLFSNLIFTIGAAMAERFVYFASLGFCFSLAVILIRLMKVPLNPAHFLNLSDFFTKHRAVLLLLLPLIFLYAVKSISRNASWKNNYTLFKHDVKLAPDNARLHFFLGNELIKTVAPSEAGGPNAAGLYLAGIHELKRSLEIYPHHADALNALGTGYLQLDSLAQAEYYFKKALEEDPTDYSPLGDFYFAKKDYNTAIEYYKKTIARDANHIDSYINLGICFGTIKQYGAAIQYLNKAATMQPSNARIYYFLASAYQFNGDVVNYEKYYRKALTLEPSLTPP